MATRPRLRLCERLAPYTSKFFAERRTSLISLTVPKREPGQTKQNNLTRISDEPFGLLTMRAPQHKLMLNNSGDLTMHRALVSAILAGLIASAHAHPKTTPSIIKPEAVTQATLQKTSEVVKLRATRETSASHTVKEGTSPVESGWGKYGTLLATIIVMCAIALRRQRLGRP